MAAQTTMGVKLDRSVQSRLKTLARRKDRTPHWLLKKAIEEYLNREEQWEREKLEDQQRWEEYAETGEAYSLDQVTTWMRASREGKKTRWPR